MRGLLAAVLVASLALTAGAAHAARAPGHEPPRISAKAFVAVDAASGEVLVARNARQRLPIASLTKIMTALVVIERGRLDEKIRVPRLATTVEPSKEYLVAGKRYKRSTLLWSTLLNSANDSATALAWDVGAGSLGRFYDAMNARAQVLGLTDTTYASASGLDDERNLSTALDQARLARVALRNPLFAKIVATERKRVRWAAPTHAKLWVNHNRMLSSYSGTYGVKTGWTTKAGGCLAVAVRRGGRDVVAVVLGSHGIWHDMPLVLEKAFASPPR
jgi:D-alanyl-D-alanine carboxypeptidase (penicillin-binding protein 5/6)